METAFLYTERYFSYDYGLSHPLRIERLRLTFLLCKAYDLFHGSKTRLIEVEPASENDILRYHSRAYIEALKKANTGDSGHMFHYGIGPGDNPAFGGLWEWSCLHAGASLQCVDLVSHGRCRIAFNIAGGLHHAHEERASGFCYVNDPVLAILSLLEQGHRVLYLDIDAHHGDGVQWAFYDNPQVLTVSFHQDGRTLFPGTGGLEEIGRGAGKGFSVNIPMLPGTDDEVFWKGFQAVLPRLLEQFNPDVLVTQLGADTFRTDPLAMLELTTNGLCDVISYLVKTEKPWIALGGGGYDIHNVARAWTLAWAIMNGVDLPEKIPDSIREYLRGTGENKDLLRDAPHRSTEQNRCMRHMEQCIGFVEKNIIPR